MAKNDKKTKENKITKKHFTQKQHLAARSSLISRIERKCSGKVKIKSTCSMCGTCCVDDNSEYTRSNDIQMSLHQQKNTEKNQGI